jgi:hypothetical protein
VEAQEGVILHQQQVLREQLTQAAVEVVVNKVQRAIQAVQA